MVEASRDKARVAHQTNSRDMSQAKSVICFDYGTATIGVAVGQFITGTASPLDDLRARDGIPNWDSIAKIIEDWRPDLLLVGLPLNMDGSESELSARARKFANRLYGRFGLPVKMADERLSSFEAKGRILERTGSQDFKGNRVDSLAAQLILESWLREQ